MADNKLTITALIKAKAGMEEKAKQELMSLVGPTRAEKGCIDFDLHQSTDDKSLFMFYENWTSKDALDAHMQAPHIKAFGGKAAELLAEPIKATFWGQLL
jgi:quinol monooxygenase YgiN